MFAVRLPAIAAAWLTILVVLVWGWRRLGPVGALFAALVLATSFGFLYVHSGRSANSDAPLTVFALLIVVALDLAADRPWLRVWLGPLLARAVSQRCSGIEHLNGGDGRVDRADLDSVRLDAEHLFDLGSRLRP